MANPPVNGFPSHESEEKSAIKVKCTKAIPANDKSAKLTLVLLNPDYALTFANM